MTTMERIQEHVASLERRIAVLEEEIAWMQEDRLRMFDTYILTSRFNNKE